MAYCGPRGIAYGHWLGGPNRWDDLSRAAALAWMDDQAARCPGCGTYHDTWLDEAGRELRDPPLELRTRYCVGCELLADKQAEIAEDHRKGLHPKWAEPASPDVPDEDPTVTG